MGVCGKCVRPAEPLSSKRRSQHGAVPRLRLVVSHPHTGNVAGPNRGSWSLSGGHATWTWYGNPAPVPPNDDHAVWSTTRRRARTKVALLLILWVVERA